MFRRKKLTTLVLFFILTSFIQLWSQDETSVKTEKTQKSLFTKKIEDFVSPEEKSKTPQKQEDVVQKQAIDEVKEEIQKEVAQEKSEKADVAEEPKDIFLNFENTELSNFVNYMAELKKINLIPDKALQGVKVSLTIRNPLTVDGAWKVFLTILEMGGFSIVEKGEVQVIVPKAQKAKQPLPAYINVPLDTLPDSDISLRYVTFLQNIGVGEIQELLKSMLSPEAVVIPYTAVNGLIITDKSYNIKAAMKVINELDQTGLQESVVVIRLQNANATDIKTLFDQLIGTPETTNPLIRLLGRQAESTLEYFSPTTKIITEARTNSLILLGNRKSIQKIEDFIVKYLDTELKGVVSPLHIYELQNTDAESIQGILKSITEPTGEKATYGAVRGGVKYFKKMNFEVDKDGNRLLVSSTDKQDWRLLKKTIEDLDKPQPQVAIETLIVTINASDYKALGGALRNKFEGQIGKGVTFQSPTPGGTILKGEDQGAAAQSLMGNMLSGFTGEVGTTLISLGKDLNIWGAFKFLKEQTSASILSQPFFTVVNKTKANIKVGQDRQVLVETTESGFGGYEYQNAYTEITVTPQINLDGIIRLNLIVSLQEFVDPTSGNKSVKTLTTDVSVADGQVLVLGGFVRTNVSESQFKTPILGDIPILGWIFKYKKRTIIKDYIFFFMSPTIVKPRTTPGSNLYTRMKLHSATDGIEEAVETKNTKDPIHNWFFNPEGENYSHKVVDFANARYQPTTVDIKNDPYYRAVLKNGLKDEMKKDEIFDEREEKKEQVLTEEIQNEEEKLLSQKRKQLKEMISKTPLVFQEKLKTVPQPPAEIEKKEQLKEFISTEPRINKNELISQNDEKNENKVNLQQKTSSLNKNSRKLKSRRLG